MVGQGGATLASPHPDTGRSPTAFKVQALARCTWVSSLPLPPDKPTPAHTQSHSGHRMTPNDSLCVLRQNLRRQPKRALPVSVDHRVVLFAALLALIASVAGLSVSGGGVDSKPTPRTVAETVPIGGSVGGGNSDSLNTSHPRSHSVPAVVEQCRSHRPPHK